MTAHNTIGHKAPGLRKGFTLVAIPLAQHLAEKPYRGGYIYRKPEPGSLSTGFRHAYSFDPMDDGRAMLRFGDGTGMEVAMDSDQAIYVERKDEP